MARTAMTPEERRAILNGSGEPHINPIDYKGTMCVALNYYNIEVDSKKKRKYAEEYAKRVLGLDVSHAPDYLLNTIGAVCRLINRGEPVTDFDIARCHEGLTCIATGKVKARTVSKELQEALLLKQQKQKKTPEEIAEELSLPIIESIEYAIDDLLLKDAAGGSDFNVKSISLQNKKAATIVTDFVENRLSVYEDLKTTKESDLKEGYSNISRRKLNHLTILMTDILKKLKQTVAIAKVKKPRAKKEKPAHVLVSKLKYAKESIELAVKSVNPEEIVGSTEVTLFNTKYRRLSILRALEGQQLTVKGSTIINIDPTSSVCKTLRKPEEQLKQFVKQTKRNTATNFKSIKATERITNGRCNEEIIIINVNK